jgi:two-component system response regulator HupR/HoxA
MNVPKAAPSRPLVLLVDDDAGLLETTSALLEDDFEIVTATCGEEALRLITIHDIDVLCTDYNMPGMDGIELLRRVMAQRRHVSGILVSGYREFLDCSQKNPSDRYLLLVKPYSPAALTDLVNKAVRHTSIKRSLHQPGRADVA